MRTAAIPNINENVLLIWNSYALLTGMQTGTSALRHSLVTSSKILHKYNINPAVI